MSQAKHKKASEKAQPLGLPQPSRQDGSSDSSVGYDSDASIEKDDTELRLEKILFGDNVGFHEDLKNHQKGVGAAGENGDVEFQPDSGENTAPEAEMEGIDDADVCAHLSCR